MCRSVYYSVAGRMRHFKSTATTFDGLRKDLIRNDAGLPSEFCIYVRVQQGSEHVWETETYHNGVIPQGYGSEDPLYIEIEPSRPPGRFVVNTLWGTTKVV